jgi:hypothetical protein
VIEFRKAEEAHGITTMRKLHHIAQYITIHSPCV